MMNKKYVALISLLSICPFIGAAEESLDVAMQPAEIAQAVADKTSRKVGTAKITKKEKKEDKKGKFKAAKLAVIDAQEVIKLTGIDKGPLKDLTDLQRKYQEQFKEEAAELLKKEQELKAKASTLTVEALKKQQEEIEDENNKMQVKLNRANNELRNADMQARAKIGGMLEQYAKTMIHESGYDVIFERNGGLVAFSSRVDKTSDLVRVIKADQAKRVTKEKEVKHEAGLKNE